MRNSCNATGWNRWAAAIVGIGLGLSATSESLAATDATAERGAVLAAMEKAFAQQQRVDVLADGDGAAQDGLGSSVAHDGVTAIVGAPYDDRNGYSNIGSAYVYTVGGGWGQLAKLTPTGFPLGTNHYAGSSVCIDGDLAVLGAPEDPVGASPGSGRVIVFTRSAGVWTQRTMLVGSDSAARDAFGFSVACDASTSTIVVGAQRDDNSEGTDAGSAYVFTGSGASWTQQAKLIGAGMGSGAWYGYSIAIDNDTVVVGARRAVGAAATSGAAYVHVRNGTTWSQQAKLFPTGGLLNDQFGWSVDVHGDTAIVGAPYDDYGTTSDAGTVHIYLRTGTTWATQAVLQPGSPQAADLFGIAVAVNGDRAVVGSELDNTPLATDSGSGYVFERTGTLWTERTLLVGANWAVLNGAGGGHAVDVVGNVVLVGAYHDWTSAGLEAGSVSAFDDNAGGWVERKRITAGDPSTANYFGQSVDIDGSIAVVGVNNDGADQTYSSGSAYVFEKSAGIWSRSAILVAPDAANADRFGSSVAVSGNRILVGAPDRNSSGTLAGSAYFFEKVAGNWNFILRVDDPNGAGGPHFGSAVDLQGDTAIVGARSGYNFLTSSTSGTAFVYNNVAGMWTYSTRLDSSDGGASDNFGSGIALDGSSVIVGAPLADNTGLGLIDSGAAYVFVNNAGIWSEQAKLIATDAESSDNFGRAVALRGDTALVGAPLDNHPTSADAGSVYAYTRAGTLWTERTRIVAQDALASDSFGYAVAYDGTTALIGAYLDDHVSGANAGSVYEFTGADATWGQQQRYAATDGLGNDYFGIALAISGGEVLIGAYGRDSSFGGDAAGSAYFFATVPPTTTTITSHTPSATVVGQSYTVNFSVTSATGTPAGTVSVSDGAATCSGNLSAGAGSCALISTGAGSKTLVAGYQGNASHAASTSAGVSHSVNPAATTITIYSDSPDPSQVAELVQVNFSLSVVAPGVGTPGGTVQVGDGVDSCLATLPTLFCNLTLNSSGLRTLTATYSGDANFQTSQDSEAHGVGAPSDVAISIDNGVTESVPGTTSVYTIVASNAGPNVATGALVQASYSAATYSGSTWTCVAAGGASCPQPSGLGAISESGDLPVGGSLTYALSATLRPSATGIASVLAQVTAGNDPSPFDNNATDTDGLTPRADIAVSLNNGANFLPAALPVVYTLVIGNAGPSDAPSVDVATLMPATLSGATWTCSVAGAAACGAASGNGEIADVATIPRSGSVTYVLSAALQAGYEGDVTTSAAASVFGGVIDPNLSNNAAADADIADLYGDGFDE